MVDLTLKQIVLYCLADTVVGMQIAEAPSENEVGLFDVQILVDALLHYLKAYRVAFEQQGPRIEAGRAVGVAVPFTPPDLIKSLKNSGDVRIDDMLVALDEGSFATAELLLRTTERTLQKECGIAAVVARQLVGILRQQPNMVWVEGVDNWKEVKQQALGAVRQLMENRASVYMAQMDETGWKYDPKDPGIDGEDLGICHVLRELEVQERKNGRQAVLYTADRYLGLGSPHALDKDITGEKHSVWYEKPSQESEWYAYLAYNVNPSEQEKRTEQQRKHRRILVVNKNLVKANSYGR